jgi:hypothetical protein
MLSFFGHVGTPAQSILIAPKTCVKVWWCSYEIIISYIAMNPRKAPSVLKASTLAYSYFSPSLLFSYLFLNINPILLIFCIKLVKLIIFWFWTKPNHTLTHRRGSTRLHASVFFFSPGAFHVLTRTCMERLHVRSWHARTHGNVRSECMHVHVWHDYIPL